MRFGAAGTLVVDEEEDDHDEEDGGGDGEHDHQDPVRVLCGSEESGLRVVTVRREAWRVLGAFRES